MKTRIVTDSSSNLFALQGVDFACVPMKIITRQAEYADTPALDVAAMVEALRRAGGPSSSSCPNTHEWLTAFGDADEVFAVTITGTLSGSHSAAVQAAEEYRAAHPGAKVCVLDSLSAGPELQLTIERLRDGILAGVPFETLAEEARAGMKRTHLSFALQSMSNLASNGRVSPAVAKLASVLGICVVGRASAEGTLEPLHKCRGEKNALRTLFSDMKAMGYAGGRVRIAHCMNGAGAQQLVALIRAKHPDADVTVDVCGGLCSYYAEKGGLMVGFDGAE